MRVTSIVCIFLLLHGWQAKPQSSPLLESYISEGLKNNLKLKQKKLSYQEALEDIEISRGAFFPNISLNARYTVADGGRLIEFPVGDLLNPVYSTLHQMTASMPPSQQFPDRTVENQAFRFYRPTEHETKLEMVQPLFYPPLYHNLKIKKDLAALGKLDQEAYRRELIAEIKIAYFNYLKTLRLQEILENSRKLLNENIRVNQSLYENEKITIDNVYKAEAELQKLERQIALAVKNQNASQGYFNFLLNRPLNASVAKDSAFAVDPLPASLDSAQRIAVDNSKQLEAMHATVNVAEKNIALQQSSYLPTVSAVIDYGFQGQTYEFTKDDDFVLASLVLKWELFKGKQNANEVQKAQIEQNRQQLRLQEATSALQLEVINLFYELQSMKKEMSAIEKEKLANQMIFEVVRKKYNQQRANMLEFTDARTAYINSSQELVIATFNYYILHAQLEKTLGLFNEQTFTP